MNFIKAVGICKSRYLDLCGINFDSYRRTVARSAQMLATALKTIFPEVPDEVVHDIIAKASNDRELCIKLLSKECQNYQRQATKPSGKNSLKLPPPGTPVPPPRLSRTGCRRQESSGITSRSSSSSSQASSTGGSIQSTDQKHSDSSSCGEHTAIGKIFTMNGQISVMTPDLNVGTTSQNEVPPPPPPKLLNSMSLHNTQKLQNTSMSLGLHHSISTPAFNSSPIRNQINPEIPLNTSPLMNISDLKNVSGVPCVLIPTVGYNEEGGNSGAFLNTAKPGRTSDPLISPTGRDLNFSPAAQRRIGISGNYPNILSNQAVSSGLFRHPRQQGIHDVMQQQSNETVLKKSQEELHFAKGQELLIGELIISHNEQFQRLQNLRSDVAHMEADVRRLRSARIDSFPTEADVIRLREENAHLLLEIQRLAQDIDLANDGKALLGVLDTASTKAFHANIQTGQTSSRVSSSESRHSSSSPSLQGTCTTWTNKTKVAPRRPPPPIPPRPPIIHVTPAVSHLSEDHVRNNSSDDAQWSCSYCTFLNHPDINECECCTKPKLPRVEVSSHL